MPRKKYVCKRTKKSLSVRKCWDRRRSLMSEKVLFDSVQQVSNETSEEMFEKLVQQTRSNCNKPYTPDNLETKSRSEEEEMDVEVHCESDESDCELSQLIVEHVPIEQLEESNVTGRRIVDISHMLRQLEQVASHGKYCTMGKYKLNREIVNGLYSKFVYHCDNCDKEFTVTSETEDNKNDTNDSLVWGALSIGIGHSQAEELFAVMDVPIMSAKKFKAHENKIGKVWEEHMIKKMEENAKEEKKIAIEKGNFLNGVPYITVIGDGGWAKRSYGHGMNSSSGVGIVIGAATKKILFLAVRNKFCYVCTKTKNAGKEAPLHECFINYTGPSTGMESDVIIEAFRQSEKEYGLIYKYYIGDGDSSVFARIQEKCKYGRFVTKVECANHMTRCLSDSLHKLATNTKFPLDSRRLLTSVPEGKKITRLERLVKGVRAAIKHAGPSKSVEDIKCLRQDLKNAPNHIFGDHGNCRDTYCTLKDSDEENVLPKLDSEFITEIRKLIDKLDRKADTLVLNETTNAAERYMGLVSKLIGGKRINFTSGGSYKRRCYAAGLSHTSGPKWHLSPWKKCKGRSPGSVFKKRFLAREGARARRALRFSVQKPKKKKAKCSDTYDKNYGPYATQPDVPHEELEERMTIVLKSLEDDVTERGKLERETLGQHDNILWNEKRKNRITASKFGQVVKRLDHTSCHNLVKAFLYPKNLNTSAITFGRVHEKDAIMRYEETQNVTVNNCGLFVDPLHPFLGASPDGLVNDDGLVEVKCLPSVKKSLKEAVMENKNIFLEANKEGNITIKRRHNYYFQIQGQLNITDRKWCDLIVFTGSKEIFISRIIVDKTLWLQTMLPKLTKFFMECLLPEIADSRIVRDLRARDPVYIVQAQEERKKMIRRKLP